MTEAADKRAPVDRDGPVIRKSIGAPVSRPPATTEYWECGGMVVGRAPVSRPPRTMKITEFDGVDPVCALAILLALLTLVMQ